MAQEQVVRDVVAEWLLDESVVYLVYGDNGDQVLCIESDMVLPPVNAAILLVSALTVNAPIAVKGMSKYGEDWYGVDIVAGSVEYQVTVRLENGRTRACIERARSLLDALTELGALADFYGFGR
ncbi:MAG: hypothetical protein F7C35_08270 [Desulfurococcales archaeon]|nr:hypothetical protein [Desulfurococcales archaeon]